MTERGQCESYFSFLHQKTGLGDEYTLLLEHLLNTPFVWSVPNDDNRLMDGEELRLEFEIICGSRPPFGHISVLEVLLAICLRMSFEADESIESWFYELLINLDIHHFVNDTYELGNGHREVQARIDIFMKRKYNFDGTGGGLFPIKGTDVDQRTVELWYQMSTYLLNRIE